MAIFDIVYMGKPTDKTLEIIKGIEGVQDALLVNTEPNGRDCCEILILAENERPAEIIAINIGMAKYEEIDDEDWSSLKAKYGDIKVV